MLKNKKNRTFLKKSILSDYKSSDLGYALTFNQ